MKTNDLIWETRFPINSFITYRTRVYKVLGYSKHEGNCLYLKLNGYYIDPKDCRKSKDIEIAKYIARKISGKG